MKYVKNYTEWISEGWGPGEGTNLDPNHEEESIGLGLQTLFNFPTEISFMIHNFGKGRDGTIKVGAKGEETTGPVRSRDEYNRGPNSIKLMKFAWNELPKGENQWYDAGNGFYIPIQKAKELLDSSGVDYHKLRGSIVGKKLGIIESRTNS